MEHQSEVILFADEGDLTVGRKTSTFIWGAWDVESPDGALTETDKLLTEFKGWGYIYRPDDYTQWDRFDLLGTRADVSQKLGIDEDSGQPSFALGESNTEQVIDEASSKTDGEYYFQQSIPTSGLGYHTVPGHDFSVGDTVDVARWGKLLSAPVTKITAVDTGNGEQWAIDVGGSPLKNILALSSSNAQINAQIKQDNDKMMQLIAEQKLTIQQLASFLGLGTGNTDSASYYKIIDGLKETTKTLSYRFENFDKTFTTVLQEEIDKVNTEQAAARAQDIFLMCKNINESELKSPGAYGAYLPDMEIPDGGVLSQEHTEIRRAGNTLEFQRYTFPFRVYVTDSDGITEKAEIRQEKSVTFSTLNSGVWNLDIEGPISRYEQVYTPLTNYNEGFDFSGGTDRYLLMDITSSNERPRGIYCAVAFTTAGTGRSLIIDELDSSGNIINTQEVRANEQFDPRIPSDRSVYSWGRLGLNNVQPEKRRFKVYLRTIRNGNVHEISACYLSHKDGLTVTPIFTKSF